MPVSPVTPIVKPESGQRRVLLLTSETALEAEVRDALRIRQQEREPGLFLSLRTWILFLYQVCWRSWTCWTTSDMAISIWYISFLQHLLGLAPATLHIQGSPPSAQDLLHWVSLHFRQTRPRRSTRPIELWKSQFGSRSSRSNAHQNSLVSILFSPKTLEDTVYMVPLPHGYYGSFVFLRAYVTLGVQLPTCVSSPDRNTSGRLEFSPTVPVSVLSCFWAGPTWLKFKTDSSTKALCLSPDLVAVSIPLLLA